MDKKKTKGRWKYLSISLVILLISMLIPFLGIVEEIIDSPIGHVILELNNNKTEEINEIQNITNNETETQNNDTTINTTTLENDNLDETEEVIESEKTSNRIFGGGGGGSRNSPGSGTNQNNQQVPIEGLPDIKPNDIKINETNLTNSTNETINMTINNTNNSNNNTINMTDNSTVNSTINLTINNTQNNSMNNSDNSSINITDNSSRDNLTEQNGVISLLGPNRNGIDRGNLTVFSYRVDHDRDIDQCTLMIDGSVVNIDEDIVNQRIQKMHILEMTAGQFSWKIKCRDDLGNSFVSVERKITVIPSYNFIMDSFDGKDLSRLTGLTLEDQEYGKIEFLEDIDLSLGADINRFVKIGKNSVRIDSNFIPSLNKSAILTIYDVDLENPVLLLDGELCTECEILSMGSDIRFRVPHFSNYSASENSKMTINDSSEVSFKLQNQAVTFHANYTNLTSDVAIQGGSTSCNITFADTGTSSMTYISATSLYEYNRTFADVGSFNYNITCDGSSLGYTALNGSDFTSINFANTPLAADVTTISSERLVLNTTPASALAESGNVTAVNIDALQVTNSWQGFYGNVSKTVTLASSDYYVFYEWTSLNATGEVLASRNFDINFASISCSGAPVISAEETFIGHDNDSSQSVSNTFNETTHPAFSIANVTISQNTCPSINTYVNNASQSTSFFEVLLTDNSSNMIYTTLLNDSIQGFDTGTYDFQIMVGENGVGNNATTTYYFFLEME